MPSTYTKQQFNRDLKELNSLINNYNGGKKQKSKKSTKSKKKNLKRFQIIEVGGRKIKGGEGHYTGENHSSVKNRACNNACRKRGKKLLKVAIRETTRGSDHKVKMYECERTKKNKPIQVRNTKGKLLYTVKHNIKAVEVQK